MTHGGSAPGRDAITRAMESLYGPREPRHWAPLLAWALGGPDPLDGVSCYEAKGHWHFVGFGLSAEQRAHGFELTFRLRRRDGETSPPAWPVSLMQSLARRVIEDGAPLRAGEHVEAGGPLGREGREDEGGPGGENGESRLRALAFIADPDLGSIETPHGRLRFLQMVGVTLDELEAMRDWSTEGVLGLLAEDDPWLVTDPDRRSILERPGVRETIDRGIAANGSSLGRSDVEELHWEHDDGGQVRLAIGAVAVPDVQRALRGRIPFQRPYRLQGPTQAVVFWPAGTARSGEEADRDVLFVELSPELAAAVGQGLPQRAGRYTWPEMEGLSIEVRPTEIRDASGEVVEILG